MKSEDIFGKLLKEERVVETKDYLWMLHLACDWAGVSLEISPDKKDNGLMRIIVGGEMNGITLLFCRGSLTKDDILSIISDVFRYYFRSIE